MNAEEERLAELEGRRVSKIELIGFVRIHFGPPENVQLILESPFDITDRNGTTAVIFSPALRTPPQGLDRLGALFDQEVASASVRSDGAFAFAFHDGSTLTLPPNSNFEAGHLILPNQYIVVPPGGR